VVVVEWLCGVRAGVCRLEETVVRCWESSRVCEIRARSLRGDSVQVFRQAFAMACAEGEVKSLKYR
jgi:hypothetical protein